MAATTVPGARSIGLLHPGAMGSSLGGALVRAGHRVSWLAEGRSAATRRRAEAAGLLAVDRWAALLERCDVIVSICPPAAALDVAAAFARAAGPGPHPGARWLYLDANAVSPRRAEQIRSTVETAGAAFVDGDVIGPPVGQGRTCLYLSGPRAADVAALFHPGDPLVVDLGAAPTAASALKMLYAGWTKATSALLLALWTAAERSGVAAALAAEWAASQPDLPGRLERAVSGAVPKAWRFAGEMDEIAQTLTDLGLPGGFHQAAAALFVLLDEFKDRPDVELAQVVAALTAREADRHAG